MQTFKLYLTRDCDDIILDLEKANYEYAMYKNIIAYCANHLDVIPENIIDYWENKCIKATNQLHSAQAIFQSVLLTAFDDRNIKWYYNHKTRDVVIDVYDDDPVVGFNDMQDHRPAEPERPEQFNEMIARYYENHKLAIKYNKKYLSCRTITFQVTNSCNLCCTYCYQINKGTDVMKFETAKKIIDSLLNNEYNDYINTEATEGIIIDFIGGEPLLQVELIDDICDYLYQQMILLKHKWAIKFRFSICSNGTLYFTPQVQRFLDKWKWLISFSVTVDGNKELHDKCRIFQDGSPSYDLAQGAVDDYTSKGYEMGSKITISPYNVSFLSDAIISMLTKNYQFVHANCVFEKGWEYEHAKIEYNELKKIADYMLDNDYTNIYFSIFQEDSYTSIDPADDNNWCGGTGSMLAFDPEGYAYPCIRYMASSLGNTQKPLIIGHTDRGILTLEKERKCVEMLDSITRSSQSTKECMECPIGTGCSWCSGYNYQVYGTPNKRATYICYMHQAESLANVYYWNKLYRKLGHTKRFKRNCPDDWALQIISTDELEMLDNLAKDN